MSKRWMSSGCLRAAPVGEVNADKGVIAGVSVCTVGEAKGHGVSLDSEFIAEVAKQGNASKQGLKARFGHPNMCSTALGTFLGRFKNFNVDGDQVRADLFLNNSAKDTPHGDLHNYVMGMAKDEPDMFGTSIVFTPGQSYQRDASGAKVFEGLDDSEDIYVECEELHACDAVDEPAANDGLFSRFSGETLAGQMTEFLDLHPQVWEAVQSNPSILEVLGRYGDKMDEFVERYRAYREPTGGQTMTDERTDAEPLEEASVTEPEAAEMPVEKLDTAEPVAEVVEEPVDEPVADAEPDAVDEPSEPVEDEVEEELESLSREEFAQIADEFGDAVAAQVMREGGDYFTALQISHDSLKVENEQLRASVGKGQPAKVVVAKEKKPLFSTGQ